MPWRPGLSWRSQYSTLLKKVSASLALPSVTVTSSSLPRRLRLRRDVTFATPAETVTSPPSRPAPRGGSPPARPHPPPHGPGGGPADPGAHDVLAPGTA